MRVALFTETFLPKVDGIVNTLCHLLDHLELRGHQSLLFAPQGAPRRYAGTAVVTPPAITAPIYTELKIVPPTVKVYERLRAFGPDVVHLVNPFFLGLAGLRSSRRLEVPIVASYQTDLPGFMRRWYLGAFTGIVDGYTRWLHNQADLNVTPSHTTREMLEARGFQRVKVWERGVDTLRFHPNRRSDVWRWRLSDGEPDKPVLLFVGRVSFEKQVDWLLPVIEALPGARLAIIGDGPARPVLERTFAGTPTVFTGYLRGDDLYDAYASADIFCFPSPHETVGNVVLEAMASGLPVIAPRSGGLLDHVSDGENGLLFDPDDEVAFVTQTRHLIEDLAMARHLGLAGRRYVETRSWEVTLDALLEEYQGVISQGPQHSRRQLLHHVLRPSW